ncbi:MAG: hypothetical protein K8T90_02720 [Planctomycetes bacterium]|nr:hypothetical protein [Planctomycetota bacterium]
MSNQDRNTTFDGSFTADGPEWDEFRQDAETIRKDLERLLRRRMIHDPRAAKARLQNISPPDLADESYAWALEEWRSKPHATSPQMWVRKRALQLLDESLDTESLAAESRAEERLEESRILARELLTDDQERDRRLELLESEGGDDSLPFDSIAADEAVSNVESRLAETELLERLDGALARLSETTRRVVVHSFLDDLPADDVAYLLDLSAEDVVRELASGVKALRADLTPKG